MVTLVENRSDRLIEEVRAQRIGRASSPSSHSKPAHRQPLPFWPSPDRRDAVQALNTDVPVRYAGVP